MAIDFPSSPVNGQSFGAFTYDSSLPGWRSTPEVASGLAAGTMVQWPGSTPPANWLICDGSAVSRSTYPSLFAAIGTTYGSGDGSTTFNLPNLKGRVAVGRDSSQTEFDTLGETGGAKTHTLTVSEMPSHTHQISVGTSADWNDYFAGSTNTYGINPTYSGTAYSSPLSNVGGDGAHNNLQPYVVLNYIIKTSAGVTAGDSELATRVGATEARATALETRATNLESKSHNYLINGAFDFWQRGTSFSATGYTADRWGIIAASGQTVSVSQQTFTPGAAPVDGYEGQYFARIAWSGTPSGTFWFTQRVEDVRTLAGQTATLSFWAKASSGTSVFVPTIEQNFGSGGSSGVTVQSSSITLTTSWQRFSTTFSVPSISGKTIGTSSYLDVRPLYGGASVNGINIDIWGVQLEDGSVATPFRRNSPNLQAELAACQRYYWRFTQENNYYMFNSATCWSSGGEMIVNVSLPVTQRVTGTQAMTNISSIYWLGNGTNITGATGPSYRPTKEAFVLVCTVPNQTATNTWAFRPVVNSYLESNAEI